MVDITTYALLATSFFFVALSFALLARYRRLSQTISTSTDLGRDLWESLEQRLRKQDERILDMMGRLEVVQARSMAAAVAQPQMSLPSAPTTTSAVALVEEEATTLGQPSPSMQQPRSQESRQSQSESQQSQAPAPSGPTAAETRLDETQLAAIGLLGQGPKNTRELTDTLKKSREHTARIMKELFERGFVRRNDSSKPFVYELTEEGRSHLSQGPTNN